jgi:O-antigen ligase
MSRAQNIFCFLFILMLALIPVAAVSVPRGVVFLPGLIGLLCLSFYYHVFKIKPRFSKVASLTALIISIFAVASSFWAIDPDASLNMSLRASAVLLSGSLLVSAVQTVKIENLKPCLWMLPASLFLASTLIFIELECGAFFFRLARHMPTGSFVKPAEFNRASVIIILLFFPAMAILKNYIGFKKTILAVLFTMIPMLIVTDSQSSQLALIFGLITLLVFPYRHKLAWYMLAAGIFTLMLSAPFLCIWIFDHYANSINAMPMMGKGGAYSGARLEIWDYISRYMINNPLYGHGFEATRQVEHFDSHEIFQGGTTILHPHNFVIQIWMEDGLVGILAAATALVGLLLAMQKYLTIPQARIALPTLVSCMLVASTGYGMWQGWWIGTLFTTASVCLLAIRQEKVKTDIQ